MDGWMDGWRDGDGTGVIKKFRPIRSVGRTEVSRRDRERNPCRTRRGRGEATKRGRNTAQDSVTDVGDGRLRVASDTASNAEPTAFSFPTLPSTTVDGLYLSQKFLVGATRVVSTCVRRRWAFAVFADSRPPTPDEVRPRPEQLRSRSPGVASRNDAAKRTFLRTTDTNPTRY
jgi:hypothetical protein